MSRCGSDPRLGTEPKLGENDKLSEVMFSSRMLAVAGGGPAATGVGSGVGVLLLSGRKIVLKPRPFQAPTNATSGPRLGGEMAAGGGTAAVTSSARGETTGALGIGGTSPNTKSSGTEIFADLIGSLINFGFFHSRRSASAPLPVWLIPSRLSDEERL